MFTVPNKLLKTISLVNNSPYKIINIQNGSKLLIIPTKTFHSEELKCWKCGVNTKSEVIFCEKCNVIQKPAHAENYFNILGLQENFDVDLKALTQKYRQLQALLHPDKYTNKSSEEKIISEEYSSAVNNAYNILQSPINRGLHLLSLKGEKIDENFDKNTDQQFLLEVMELNEEVEDAQQKPEQLLELNKKNKKELQNIAENLSNAFKNNDIKTAKNLLIRMKYYVSISIQINHILREKGIVE